MFGLSDIFITLEVCTHTANPVKMWTHSNETELMKATWWVKVAVMDEDDKWQWIYLLVRCHGEPQPSSPAFLPWQPPRLGTGNFYFQDRKIKANCSGKSFLVLWSTLLVSSVSSFFFFSSSSSNACLHWFSRKSSYSEWACLTACMKSFAMGTNW